MSTVLAIDDDRGVRYFIQEAFKASDINVCAAKTAEEGLEALRARVARRRFAGRDAAASLGLGGF